jgi:hypothetical protein
VELDEGNGGIVLNISEGGLSVQAYTSVIDDVLPEVRFQLSESEGWIHANARVSWTSESRKLAGLEFVDLPDDARLQIKEWLIREALLPRAAPEEGATSTPKENEPSVTPPDTHKSWGTSFPFGRSRPGCSCQCGIWDAAARRANPGGVFVSGAGRFRANPGSLA